MEKQENAIKENRYSRLCPSCSKEIFYYHKYVCEDSIKKNKLCQFCARQNTGSKNLGTVRTDEFKENLSIKMINHPSIVDNKERGDKIRDKLLGRDVSSWRPKGIKYHKNCIQCNGGFEVSVDRQIQHFCGVECMTEYYHQNGKWNPRYNPKGCELIEAYGFKEGYNFQHALNGGEFRIKELKYWVDGYDKDSNVVIEYNEKHHYNHKNIILDKQRRELIMEYLKCKFIVINYKGEIKIYE